MKEKDETDRITRYLLGQVSDQERTKIEEKYFSDPGVLDQVLIVEDDLIDAYARGDLTQRERQLFESHFMVSQARREKAQMAKALMKCLSEELPPAEPKVSASWRPVLAKSFAVRFALATGLIVLAIATSWLFIQTRQLRNELGDAQRERVRLEQELADERAKSEQLAQELGRHKTISGPVEPVRGIEPKVAFVLLPGLTRDRGEQLRKVVIPVGSRAVSFQLAIESSADYGQYRAELRGGENVIWSATRLKARRSGVAKAVFITIPTTVFTSGQYLLSLAGLPAGGATEFIHDYGFRVVKE